MASLTGRGLFTLTPNILNSSRCVALSDERHSRAASTVRCPDALKDIVCMGVFVDLDIETVSDGVHFL